MVHVKPVLFGRDKIICIVLNTIPTYVSHYMSKSSFFATCVAKKLPAST